MEPNQNPPSEKEWTLEEQEEFFSSPDAVTGLLSGAVANNACLKDEWRNLSVTSRGIHVTRVGEPEQGWLMSFYCPLCKETTFLLSPYACKPSEGDYWRMKEMCANEEHAFNHNLRFALKMRPIQYQPPHSNPKLWWTEETL